MKRLNDNIKAFIAVVLSAMLYALCIPCLKLLNGPEVITGGLLYLGAGIGLTLISGIKRSKDDLKLTKKELPYAFAMVLLDITAVICLVLGVARTTGANVSLLGNFELVATALIAAFIFKERVSKRIFCAVCLITAACIILSFEKGSPFVFNLGSLLVLLSCVCWGAENNCTKMMSKKDTRQITTIKGIFAGAGGVLIALIAGETIPDMKYIAAVMLLGFVSYGISVCLYIYAQRFLGAAKTSAINSFAPFFGVFFCFLFLSESTGAKFFIALAIMIAGSATVISETLKKRE